MAAKQGGKVNFISPVNYVRTKSRTLPIYECLVNSGWEDHKMVNVIVARQHVNGNITAGFYLVDLLCRGIKDSYFIFNTPLHEYEEIVEQHFPDRSVAMERVDYALAHNIIFAGYEFASEYNIKAHKDFENTTRFLLEEDDDNVELIDIPCGGDDGLPTIIMGPDNRNECLRTIAHLEKYAGKGNFHVHVVDGDEDFEDGADEYSEDDLEEDIREFKELSAKLDKLDKEGIEEILDIALRIFYHGIDNEELDNELEMLHSKYPLDMICNDIPDDMIVSHGLNAGEVEVLKQRLHEALSIPIDDDRIEEAKAALEALKKDYPNQPAVDLLEHRLTASDLPGEMAEKVRALTHKHPGYTLFRLMDDTHPDNDQEFSYPALSQYFGEREKLYWLEYHYFMKLVTLHVVLATNPVPVAALYEYIDDERVPHETFLVIHTILTGIIMFFAEEVAKKS